MKNLLMFIISSVVATTALADDAMDLKRTDWGESDQTRVALQFVDDGKVMGNFGCNSFTGTYTQNGSSLTFGPLAATRMACGAEVMETEARVSAALAATTTAEITRPKLVLRDASGRNVLIFERRDLE